MKVRSDPDRIQQVLVTLLQEAVSKAMVASTIEVKFFTQMQS